MQRLNPKAIVKPNTLIIRPRSIWRGLITKETKKTTGIGELTHKAIINAFALEGGLEL